MSDSARELLRRYSQARVGQVPEAVAELLERVDALEADNASLRMDRDSSEHMRRKDNEYLQGRVDVLAEALQEIEWIQPSEAEGFGGYVARVHGIVNAALAAVGDEPAKESPRNLTSETPKENA